MLTRHRRWLSIALVLPLGAGCAGIGGLDDKADAEVVRSDLIVYSCWPDDRLVSLRVVRPGSVDWSAVERNGAGLPLNPVVTVNQVVSSGFYAISGNLPTALAVGDHIYFETTRESRNFLLTKEMLENTADVRC